MKVTGPCKVVWIKEKRVAWMRPNPEDELAFSSLFSRMEDRQDQSGIRIYPVVTIFLPERERTFKQNNTLWALITVIFVSMNGRKPTDTEKYDLYLDILEEYADRIPTRFSSKLRPIHISESDTVHAAKLIQACFDVIVEYCDLDVDLQADVRQLLYEWHTWRGELDRDPLDYGIDDTEMDEGEWRANHRVSDASGIGGELEKAHIVSRGASVSAIEKPWNWLMLTVNEHRFVQHQHGWNTFLEKYPHLKGRVSRAQLLAGKLSEHADKSVEVKNG